MIFDYCAPYALCLRNVAFYYVDLGKRSPKLCESQNKHPDKSSSLTT